MFSDRANVAQHINISIIIQFVRCYRVEQHVKTPEVKRFYSSKVVLFFLVADSSHHVD